MFGHFISIRGVLLHLAEWLPLFRCWELADGYEGGFGRLSEAPFLYTEAKGYHLDSLMAKHMCAG